mgnify:CR=1 FL=1
MDRLRSVTTPLLIAFILPLQLTAETVTHSNQAATLPAQQQYTPQKPHSVCPTVLSRPCIGLVLGGGGARGSAHIGVIKALEEHNIPVDIVVGTSIGSFVGGLYASGKSADDIEYLFRNTDWNAGYRDDTNRSKIPNRRKRQLDNYPIHLDLGFGREGIRLPQGFLQGQGMKTLVDSMLGNYPQFNSFDTLPIPFRAVAADAETGEEVILGAGDLATALQISMSLPGIVRPIEVNGRLLVDGGIANNLPVSVAKELGADIIIAVDIGSPTKGRDELDSGFTILRQLTGFLTRSNVEYQKSLLDDNDLYLHPDIQGVGLLSFDRTLEAVAAGYDEAQRQLKNSAALTAIAPTVLSPKTNEATKPQDKNADKAIHIDNIVLNNNSRLGDDYILHRMGLETNQQQSNNYTTEEIQQGVDRLYGQGTIARVNTTIIETPEATTLDILVGEKEWGPGYLDFKLAVEDDFSSFSRYQIGGSYRLTNLSPYGAEWFSAAEFGTNKLLLSELYWPIKTSGFYLSTGGIFERNIQQNTLEGVSVGASTIVQSRLLAGLGWDALDQLDANLSAIYTDGSLELPDILSEALNIDDIKFKQSGLLLALNYDSLDNATFPSRGIKLAAALQRTKDELDTIEDYSTQADIELNLVGSIGRNSLRTLLRYQSTINDDPLSLLGGFELGGFFNLSGNSPGIITGQHVRFASVVYSYELAANDFGAINLPLYVGVSAEAGNAWDDKSDIDYDDLIYSGSLFIGWDSPLGPAYIAYGKSDTGQHSLYITLGVIF